MYVPVHIMYRHLSLKSGKQTESQMLCEFFGMQTTYMFPLIVLNCIKKRPLVSFATAWNSIDDRKYNPRQKTF
jgi:hypothetical protein